MAGFPKIGNPFEDETDFIDQTDPADLAKQAAQQATKAVNQQVVKPVTQQVDPNQAIVDFLYGASEAPAAPDSGDQSAAGIEQMAQAAQTNPQQAAKMQQIMDPDQQMASSEKAQLSEEQIEQREKHRLHIRNYYTMGNKLDDIGQLEEQIAKVRQQKEQEEQQRQQEEEEEAERKRQEEEAQRQQIAAPTGKRTGQAGKAPSAQDEMVKREQNKAENKTGFSG